MTIEALRLSRPGWTMRAWQDGDVARLTQIANDERIVRWMSDLWPEPYTELDARWWVDTGSKQGLMWAICLDDVAQGGVGCNPQTGWQRCNGEIGWWLWPEHWGLGLVPEAAQLMMTQALLQHPELTRLFAPIHAGNQPSMRVAEKLGMHLEGVQRRSAIKRGEVIDRHLYAWVL